MRRRIENPLAPRHPDEGRKILPQQKFRVRSGGFCFGFRHEVQSGATEELMDFSKASIVTSTMGYHIPHNTAAKNGKWYGYQLGSSDGEYTAGWFLCHRKVNPVVELRQIIYNTFMAWQNGGNDPDEHSKQLTTGSHHLHWRYILLPRCLMGFPMDIPDECNEDEIMKQGMCVVDYDDAQQEGKKSWKNSIHGMDIGDQVVGRLAYDDDGLCKAFLITGMSVQFQHTHFVGGTAPLGHDKWCECGGLEHIECARIPEGQAKITSYFSRSAESKNS